jgi:hypothetical protein
LEKQPPNDIKPDYVGPKRPPLKRVGRAKLIRKNEGGQSTKKVLMKADAARARLQAHQNETPKVVHMSRTDVIPPESPFYALSDPEKVQGMRDEQQRLMDKLIAEHERRAAASKRK